MNIQKIRFTKDEKIRVEYTEISPVGETDEYSFACKQKARPEFYRALAALSEDVIELCELPDDYEERITVKGVSFSYGGEKKVMGAVIIASMRLENSNCPLNLITPHKPSDSYSDTEVPEDMLLSEECISRLDDLLHETVLYIKGDRAQASMFDVKKEAVA